MKAPPIPSLGTLPLPVEWARFLADLLAYVETLEKRLAKLET